MIVKSVKPALPIADPPAVEPMVRLTISDSHGFLGDAVGLRDMNLRFGSRVDMSMDLNPNKSSLIWVSAPKVWDELPFFLGSLRDQGNRPALLESFSDHLNMASLLKRQGARPNVFQGGSEQREPRNKQSPSWLLNAGPRLVGAPPTGGNTPLGWAFANGVPNQNPVLQWFTQNHASGNTKATAVSGWDCPLLTFIYPNF